MQNSTTEPMDASKQFCPNTACSARGQIGAGNIRIPDRKRQRYRCTQCKQTFSARRGTMLEGLRKPTELIVIVVSLLAYVCPLQAIVHAFGVDERTVASGAIAPDSIANTCIKPWCHKDGWMSNTSKWMRFA